MTRTDRAVGGARLAFAATAWLFLLGVVVQVFLVGVDVFAGGDSATHRDFAYVYGWLAPALILLAAAAHASRTTRSLTIALVVLFAIQTVLPSQRDAVPLLAALHTPNALAIFALAVTLARRSTPIDGWLPTFRRVARGVDLPGPR